MQDVVSVRENAVSENSSLVDYSYQTARKDNVIKPFAVRDRHVLCFGTYIVGGHQPYSVFFLEGHNILGKELSTKNHWLDVPVCVATSKRGMV